MVTGEEWVMIKLLHQEGLTISEIARSTGYDRKTVRKHLAEAAPPRYSERPVRPHKLDPYKPYVLKRIQEGVLNCANLLRELKAQGYPGGVTQLRLFVQPLRIEPREIATLRFETSPGEQAQVDWSSFGFFQGHRLSAFLMTLGYSRMKYLQFTLTQDLEVFLSCHLSAFEAFGGSPQTILYDNLKSVVLGREAEGVRFNPRFLDFASVFGFLPRLCQPYRAQTKGKVENAIGYAKKNFWPGRRFEDLTDLNTQAKEWCKTIANALPHGTTRIPPQERLKEERLQPLDGKTYDTSYRVNRIVSKDCLISYQGSRYSVPWIYVRKSVVVKIPVGGRQLSIACQDQVIATHSLSVVPGSLVMDPSHYAGLPRQKRPWLVERGAAHRGIPLPPGPGLGVNPNAPEVEIRPLTVYEGFCEPEEVANVCAAD